MKKILLFGLMVVLMFGMSACTMVFAEPHIGEYRETYTGDYAYLDRYSGVQWNNAEYGHMEYAYYDYERVFLVIYGNRVYIIPYDYFYHYILSHFQGRLIWRSYDYLAGWWGWRYYNILWGNWYYRHNRSYWRHNRDYYYHHRRNNNNPRYIINKGRLEQPENDRNSTPKYEYRPKNDGNRGYDTEYRSKRPENSGNLARIGGNSTQGARSTPSATKKSNSGAARARKKG